MNTFSKVNVDQLDLEEYPELKEDRPAPAAGPGCVRQSAASWRARRRAAPVGRLQPCQGQRPSPAEQALAKGALGAAWAAPMGTLAPCQARPPSPAERMLATGASPSDAARRAAKELGARKKEAYALALRLAGKL